MTTTATTNQTRSNRTFNYTSGLARTLHLETVQPFAAYPQIRRGSVRSVLIEEELAILDINFDARTIGVEQYANEAELAAAWAFVASDADSEDEPARDYETQELRRDYYRNLGV